MCLVSLPSCDKICDRNAPQSLRQQGLGIPEEVVQGACNSTSNETTGARPGDVHGQ